MIFTNCKACAHPRAYHYKEVGPCWHNWCHCPRHNTEERDPR